MHGTARTLALALALCASGCWTNACVEPSPGGGLRCSEELGSIFSGDETPGEGEAGAGTCAASCEDLRAMSSCEDQGFDQLCDDGYWYREACSGEAGGGSGGGGGGGGGSPHYEPHRLTVSRIGDGTVRSSPGGIECGSTCSAVLVNGARVTVTATPGAGGIFLGFGGACSGAGACTLVMSADRAVTATFVPAPGAP